MQPIGRVHEGSQIHGGEKITMEDKTHLGSTKGGGGQIHAGQPSESKKRGQLSRRREEESCLASFHSVVA